MEVQQLEMGVHPEQMPWNGAMNPDPNMGAMPQDPGIDGGATEARNAKGGEI